MSARDRILRVDDYQHGLSSEAEAAELEHELFEAAAAGDDADVRYVDALTRAAVFILQHASFDSGTRAQVDALRAAGARVHFEDFGAGGSVEVTDWDEGATDVVVFRLAVDLRGYDEIDVEVETPDGRPIKTFRDVRCDPTDGALYAVCEPPLARMAFCKHVRRARVLAKRDSSPTRETVAIYETSPPRAR